LGDSRRDEASLGVVSDEADKCRAILAEHFVLYPFARFLSGRPRASGSCSQGKGGFIGGDLQGGPGKQSPAARRAQGCDPEQSPTVNGKRFDTEDGGGKTDFRCQPPPPALRDSFARPRDRSSNRAMTSAALRESAILWKRGDP
jgi:hypothetical protein